MGFAGITAKRHLCHLYYWVIGAKRIKRIIGANANYHSLAIGGFRIGCLGIITAKFQPSDSVIGASSVKRISRARVGGWDFYNLSGLDG